MQFYTDTLFFPAISIATHTQILKADWKIKGKSPRFYLNTLKPEQQLFNHPYILTSAGHNYKKMNFMNSIGINDVKKDVNMVFGDSGGFQIATGSLNGNDETIDKLYKWLELNSTLAPVIDVPPWNSNIDADVGNKDVAKALASTKHNIERLISRPKSDVMWLNVSHCKDYHDRIKWYNEVKGYNLQGWALGSVSKNFHILLTAIATMIDTKELENKDTCKHIHFFGITATRFMPLIIYIKNKLNSLGYKINVSFDSSYATQNGGWGKYLLFPSATGFRSYHLSNRYLDNFIDTPLPCQCPVCSNIRLKDILNKTALQSEGESYFYNVVQSHNVYVLIDYVKTLNSVLATNNEEMMKTALVKQLPPIFKIIDMMFDPSLGKSAYIHVEENQDILNKLESALIPEEERKEHMDYAFGGFFE